MLSPESSKKLAYTAGVADWLLDVGDVCARLGNVHQALICNQLAARVLARQNRNLSSPRVEANMLAFAMNLPDLREEYSRSAGDERKDLWLHVLNEALPYGGHTAMAIRWINNDKNNRVHSVALLEQKVSVPDRLRQATQERGGDVYLPDPGATLQSRAEWLRRLAHEKATVVVLHIDVDDVVARLAFGIEGGPPVLLVNHAAHIFWAGASIADVVLNCRGSQLEASWTKVHRGIPRCATVPIPLADSAPAAGPSVDARKKVLAKEKIGVPAGAFVILTVGDTYKYTPMGDLDFLAVSEQLLRELPDACMLVVGVKEDERWREASNRTGARLRAVGRQSQIGDFHDAADLYIEGFPFGSTTALLEAGLKRIPVVLAPASCPPPYGTDGAAIDDVLTRPRDIEDYKKQVLSLSANRDARERLGDQLSDSIRRHHTGEGWLRYLETLVEKLPPAHRTYPLTEAHPTSENMHHYWTEFRDKAAWDGVRTEELLDDSVYRLLVRGIKPRLTKSLWKACGVARGIRQGRAISFPSMFLLCNILFPLLPMAWATRIYRKIDFARISRTFY